MWAPYGLPTWAQYQLVRPENVDFVWATHYIVTQLDIDLDLTLILNGATAYAQKLSFTSLR